MPTQARHSTTARVSICITLALAATITQTLAQVTAPPLPPPPPEPGHLTPMEAPPAATGPARDPMAPTLVSLKTTNAQLAEVLAMLHDQSGYTFRAGNPGQNKMLTLDFQDKPLWEALSEVISNGDDPVVQLTATDAASTRPTSISSPTVRRNFTIAGRISAKGPFLLVAQTLNHSVDFEHGPDVEIIDLNASLVGDFASGYVSNVNTFNTPAKAVDEKGNSLVWTRAIPAGPANSPLRTTRVPTQPVTIRMECPESHVGKTITMMEGVVTATFSAMDTVEVPMGRSFERTLEGVTMTVEVNPPDAANPDPGAVPPARRGVRGGVNPGTPNTVFMRMNRDPAMTTEEWRTKWQAPFLAAQVALVDAEGRVWRTTGAGSGSSGDYYYRTFNFNNTAVTIDPATGRRGQAAPAGTPVKAIVDLPSSVKTIEVPYHFENLPIP